MRLSAALCGPGLPPTLPAYVSGCFHDFKRIERWAPLVIRSFMDEGPTMPATMKRYRWGAACGASLVMTSCQTVQTTRGGVVGVDRPQQMSVFTPSATEVAATARQQYLQVMQGAARKGALNRDPTQTARVQHIAQRLIPHTAVFRDDAVRWPWEVNVLTS